MTRTALKGAGVCGGRMPPLCGQYPALHSEKDKRTSKPKAWVSFLLERLVGQLFPPAAPAPLPGTGTPPRLPAARSPAGSPPRSRGGSSSPAAGRRRPPCPSRQRASKPPVPGEELKGKGPQLVPGRGRVGVRPVQEEQAPVLLYQQVFPGQIPVGEHRFPQLQPLQPAGASPPAGRGQALQALGCGGPPPLNPGGARPGPGRVQPGQQLLEPLHKRPPVPWGRPLSARGPPPAPGQRL